MMARRICTQRMQILQQRWVAVCEKSSSALCRSSVVSQKQQISSRHITIRNFSSSGKGKHNNVPKRPRVGGGGSNSSKSNLDGVWYSTSKPPSTKNLDMGQYGLKRLDYNKIEVPVWTVPPHPP